MLYETFNERDLLAEWFQNALAENGFETWFQPIVDTAGHRIIGHECLTRVSGDLSHGAEALHCGEEIVEAARVSNHLALFDSRAMALAVRSAAAQRRQLQSRSDKVSQFSHDETPGPFFINMLPGLMADPAEYMRLAMEALAASRQTSELRPQDLVFEAVDSDFAGDSARLRAAHDYIRKQGCGFALDNAGLGIGSGGRTDDPGSYCFQMIRDLRPDYVKIDRRLIWNAEKPVCASTIRKLVDLGDRYGAPVIAVGVERQRTVENLWLLGVQAMQGYLLGRPSREIVCPRIPEEIQPADSDLANLARAVESVPRNFERCSFELSEQRMEQFTEEEQFAIVCRPESAVRRRASLE